MDFARLTGNYRPARGTSASNASTNTPINHMSNHKLKKQREKLKKGSPIYIPENARGKGWSSKSPSQKYSFAYYT